MRSSLEPKPRHPPPSRPHAATGAPRPTDLRSRVLHLQRTAGNAAATWALQRQAVATPTTAKLGYEIPGFEYKAGEQRPTKETSGGWVDLAFDPATSTFTCTFRLRWRSFPEDPANTKLGWQEPANQQIFKDRFIAAIRAAWEGKFPLAEYQGGKKTGRSAKVAFKFEEVIDTSKGSVEEITARSKLPAAEAERMRSRYDIDVSLLPVRDSVLAGSIVSIDAGSLTAEKHGKHSQIAAVHEFGHMIGLADEYVMSAQDYEDTKAKVRKEEADRRRGERKKVTGRIMNVGSTISPDHYRPFARWLSDLTGGDWRV